MSDDQQTLTTEEQSFLFKTVFPGLNDRRETLDRDLFVLLARRLLDAGYTADQLEQYATRTGFTIRFSGCSVTSTNQPDSLDAR